MDQITIDCLTEWFILTGRRLELLPPARARFVEPRSSASSFRAESAERFRHNEYSVNMDAHRLAEIAETHLTGSQEYTNEPTAKG